jgi:hypothetical protein
MDRYTSLPCDEKKAADVIFSPQSKSISERTKKGYLDLNKTSKKTSTTPGCDGWQHP